MAKLLLILVAVIGFANSTIGEHSQPPLLIDNALAPATPLDAQP